ncbi:DMT(drug/metabolite transporter) superfamily permease [Burkholderiales bacterium JOSHI_001]|nr:DMT(drug/metabolite transporter) superfamily permease [Burkholderiales bacterium JOSHI_001]
MKLSRAQWVSLVALTLVWGCNWPIMKFTLREITPLWFRAITMLGGALVLLAFYRWRGLPMGLPRAQAGTVAMLALPNIVGWHFASITGLSLLASGRAATLAFTMPIWTVLLGALLAHDRLTRRAVASALAGAAAVGLLAVNELTHLAGRPVGIVWMQVAAVSWALGTLAMRRTRTPLPTEAVTVWMMLMGAAVFWALAPVFEPLPQPARFSTGMWWAMAYGVLLNFGVAQVLWFGLARNLPPAASAFSIMAVPLVGTLTATVIVGERPQATDWLAAGFIVVAVAAALLPARRASNAENASP